MQTITNENEQKEVNKYEIVMGRKNGDGVTNSILAGFAIHEEGTEYYTVRLLMFPNNPYYLSKNRDSSTTYTVFAKRVQDKKNAAIRLQNPIGSARLTEDLKTHLEIKLPLLGTSVFMSLFPLN